jgi:hypothetical protein
MLTIVAALFMAVSAHADTPTPRVAMVRVTPGAAPAKVLAFQNTSSTSDIVVRKIEIVNASTAAVTSGLMQFWVYGSTSVDHSETTTQDAYSYFAALDSQPSGLSISTKPASATYEGDSDILTAAAANNLSGSRPLLAPLIVNLDESAAANFSASWSQEQDGLFLILPAGANRALVFEKRQLGSADYTDGQVIIRIFYTLR